MAFSYSLTKFEQLESPVLLHIWLYHFWGANSSALLTNLKNRYHFKKKYDKLGK